MDNKLSGTAANNKSVTSFIYPTLFKRIGCIYLNVSKLQAIFNKRDE